MRNNFIVIMVAILLNGLATTLTGQEVTLASYRDFNYPQTPNFVDQTRPDSNSTVDTVAGLQKKDRLDNGSSHRERFGAIAMIHVLPGGLEPQQEYKFAMEQFLGASYKSGTMSFCGPADALVGITNFGWGTENNNDNYLPLLIRSDYQDIKTPALEFSWAMPQTFSNQGGVISQTSQPIALNYNFKVALKSRTDWGDAQQFNRFNVAGTVFGKSPSVTANRVFRWGFNGLETFSGDLNQPMKLRNIVTPPPGKTVEGFAVQPETGTIFFALSEKILSAYNEQGKAIWETRGRAPIIFYNNRVLAMSENYQELVVFDAATGAKVSSVKLPDFLPQYENALATISTNAGDFVLVSVPNQSRLLVYKINE